MPSPVVDKQPVETTSAAHQLHAVSSLVANFSDSGQQDSLEKYAKMTYELAEKQDEPDHILLAASQLAVIYENRGDFRTALKYHKVAREAEVALHKEAQNNGVINTERLKTEYTAMHAEALAEQQAESRRSTLLIIGIFSLAVVSKTFLLYIIIRRKRTHNKELRILLDQVERQNVQLEEGYRFKQHLISVVAHDLRTPVATIVSILRMFEDGHLSEREIRDMVQRARQEMDGLKAFLDELLTWIVGQREGLRSSPEQFDITGIVRETIDVYRRSAEAKGVHVQIDMPDAAVVEADRQMIKIILNNLVNNAIKFCNTDDRIKLSISSVSDGNWRFHIADTGMGFRKKVDKQLTEINVERTAGTWGEKTIGIGLSLCVLYLKANDSCLNVKSAPGEGAQLWFDLAAVSRTIKKKPAQLADAKH